VPVLAAGADGGSLALDRVTPARGAGLLAAATAVAGALAAVVAVVADREATGVRDVAVVDVIAR